MRSACNRPLRAPPGPAPLPQSVAGALARRGFCPLRLEDLTRDPSDPSNRAPSLTDSAKREAARQERQLETALMELFRDEGSEAAFHFLHARVSHNLRGWLVHCMRGGYPAIDPAVVIQEAWYGMVRYAKSFKGGASHPFRPWARTIVCNALRSQITWIRRMETCDERTLINHTDRHRGPSGVAQDREFEESLRRDLLILTLALGAALKGLSPRDRAVLQSIEVEGRARDQVGRDLGLGLSGVKMALHRARKRLVMAVAKNLGCSSAQIARFPAKTRAAG